MPIDPAHLCPCHGEPMYIRPVYRGNGRALCVVKRRARTTRNHAKNLHTRRRNYQTHNARRILIGQTYHSEAATVEQAQQINARIRARLNEFKQRQSAGAKTEGAAAGTVQA